MRAFSTTAELRVQNISRFCISHRPGFILLIAIDRTVSNYLCHFMLPNSCVNVMTVAASMAAGQPRITGRKAVRTNYGY